MIDLANLQIVVAGVILAMLWTLETIIPFLPDRRERIKHSARNITIGAFNAVILAVLYAPVLFRLTTWTEANNFGLLHLFDLPVWVSTTSAILFQDAWMYAWHRANHRFPFLWRFHKVHHSDPQMDASTAVRFHTGEILISAVLRLGIIIILGLSLWQVLLYDLLLVPVILFHHSNVRFPEKWDNFFRALFASPAMHRVHHSPIRIETDSNYGSVFSFWDRSARSFRLSNNVAEIRYGLNEYSKIDTEKLSVLALMPFQDLEPSKTKKQKSRTLAVSTMVREKF